MHYQFWTGVVTTICVEILVLVFVLVAFWGYLSWGSR
jgi:hypothetical protein